MAQIPSSEQFDGTPPPLPPPGALRVRLLLFFFGAVSLAAIASVAILSRQDGQEPSERATASAAAADACRTERARGEGPPAQFVWGLDEANHVSHVELGPISDVMLWALQRCLDPYEAFVFVEGLPGVSGAYEARDYAGTTSIGEAFAKRYSVFSFVAEELGQCAVGDEGEAFQTKLTETLLFAVGDGPPKIPYTVITIDVGVSGELEPFVGVVRDDLMLRSGVPETTYDYVSEAWDEATRSGANAEIQVGRLRYNGPEQPTVNPRSGIVRFVSTFHNARDYYPYKPLESESDPGEFWQGDPLYVGVITVLCG